MQATPDRFNILPEIVHSGLKNTFFCSLSLAPVDLYRRCPHLVENLTSSQDLQIMFSKSRNPAAAFQDIHIFILLLFSSSTWADGNPATSIGTFDG